MGTGPLALDDSLFPSFNNSDPGLTHLALSMSDYLARVQSVYTNRPNDGLGLILGGSMTGTWSYNGMTDQPWGLGGAFPASTNPGYFSCRVVTGAGSGSGNEFSGPGFTLSNYESCPLITDEPPVHEDAEAVVTMVLSAEIQVNLSGPMLSGPDWYSSAKVYVPFTFSFANYEGTQITCQPSGMDAGGAAARDLDTNILSLGMSDDPPPDQVGFIGIGDGSRGVWLKDKTSGSEGFILTDLSI